MPLPRPLLLGAAVAASAALSAGVALALSRHSDTAALARALAEVPTEAPAQLVPEPWTPGADPFQEPTPGADDPLEDPAQRALEAAWHPDPRGSVPQISLRFLQALQREDDLAALRQLDREERMWLSLRDLWTLHRVMTDVRKNAGLAGAGPCTHVTQISAAAAVVTCGRRHVVVNAAPRIGMTGIRLSDWTLHHDVYRGPHTHAYTLIEL